MQAQLWIGLALLALGAQPGSAALDLASSDTDHVVDERTIDLGPVPLELTPGPFLRVPGRVHAIATFSERTLASYRYGFSLDAPARMRLIVEAGGYEGRLSVDLLAPDGFTVLDPLPRFDLGPPIANGFIERPGGVREPVQLILPSRGAKLVRDFQAGDYLLAISGLFDPAIFSALFPYKRCEGAISLCDGGAILDSAVQLVAERIVTPLPAPAMMLACGLGALAWARVQRARSASARSSGAPRR